MVNVLAGLEKLKADLRAAPLFAEVSEAGIDILMRAAVRVRIKPFENLIVSDDPDSGTLGEDALLILTSNLTVDLREFQRTHVYEAGAHIGERSWMGQGGRMMSISSGDAETGAGIRIESVIGELSTEDQFQVGLNALAHSRLLDDNCRLEAASLDATDVAADLELRDLATELAKQMNLQEFSARDDEQIQPVPGHVFFGLTGRLDVFANEWGLLLSTITLPNFAFEVSGAGGTPTAKVRARNGVRGYWIPLKAAHDGFNIFAQTVLLQAVMVSHDAKLGLANEQVRHVGLSTAAPVEAGLFERLAGLFRNRVR
jgi:hypothetical protein